jgi:outer membrane protein
MQFALFTRGGAFARVCIRSLRRSTRRSLGRPRAAQRQVRDQQRSTSCGSALRAASRFGTALLAVLVFTPKTALAQEMTLRESLDTALRNYGEIRAKEARRDAARHDLSYSKKTYLPDVMLSAQQGFGTVNAMHGPLYSPGGPSNATTSLPLSEQNWNAAFGALYSVIVHWNVVTFGKIDRQIELSARTHDLRKRELELERFQHQVRVTLAYLKLSTAQRINHIQKENVSRYQVALETIASHAESGLVPGVDASLARAELASSKASQLKAYDAELEASKELAVLLGVPFREFQLEPTFYESAPENVTQPAVADGEHPLIAVHEGQVRRSEQEEKVASSEAFPSLFVFGVLQGRGSGFRHDYAMNQDAVSSSYFDGVGVDRGNYIAGVGLSWNLAGLLRSTSSSSAQEQRTRALYKERELAAQELAAQERFAERKFTIAHDNRGHAIAQRDAANDGFRQSKARYDNGLGTIVELTQAIYAVSRADVDFELAQSTIWQALLLKAASSGDLNAFLQQVRGAKTR